LFAELWISLTSLLSSYTAAHCLNSHCYATVDLEEDKIAVRNAGKRLDLVRSDANVVWMRENGQGGDLQLTLGGGLRGPAGEQALDIAAEAWARGLMQEEP
jgi:hypothetical protein